mgnify:CR=1 FL=1
MMKIIKLKPGKDKPVRRMHPWVFSGALEKIPSDVDDGEIVYLADSSGEIIATGYFCTGSIALKLFSFEKIEITYEFWLKKLKQALLLRESLGLVNSQNTNMTRLINAEGDGFPGVIADLYGDALVIHYQTRGAFLIAADIEKSIQELLPHIKSIFVKDYSSDGKTSYHLGSKPERHITKENGFKFLIDWEEGQKTGFFIDQRNNRKLLGSLCADRTVLNTFSYSGGFSVYALGAGAKEVHSVDASKKAIALCEENIALNFPNNSLGTKHKSFTDDCLTYLRNIQNQYDLIILDPPAFAKHRDAVRGAIDGYRDINRLAIKSIKPNGIIFTFSCSQLVSRDLFQEAVFSGASQANRKVQIIHRLSQSEDHPFSIYHPEGEYLKGFVLRVE